MNKEDNKILAKYNISGESNCIAYFKHLHSLLCKIHGGSKTRRFTAGILHKTSQGKCKLLNLGECWSTREFKHGVPSIQVYISRMRQLVAQDRIPGFISRLAYAAYHSVRGGSAVPPDVNYSICMDVKLFMHIVKMLASASSNIEACPVLDAQLACVIARYNDSLGEAVMEMVTRSGFWRRIGAEEEAKFLNGSPSARWNRLMEAFAPSALTPEAYVNYDGGPDVYGKLTRKDGSEDYSVGDILSGGVNQYEARYIYAENALRKAFSYYGFGKSVIRYRGMDVPRNSMYHVLYSDRVPVPREIYAAMTEYSMSLGDKFDTGDLLVQSYAALVYLLELYCFMAHVNHTSRLFGNDQFISVIRDSDIGIEFNDDDAFFSR